MVPRRHILVRKIGISVSTIVGLAIMTALSTHTLQSDRASSVEAVTGLAHHEATNTLIAGPKHSRIIHLSLARLPVNGSVQETRLVHRIGYQRHLRNKEGERLTITTDDCPFILNRHQGSSSIMPDKLRSAQSTDTPQSPLLTTIFYLPPRSHRYTPQHLTHCLHDFSLFLYCTSLHRILILFKVIFKNQPMYYPFFLLPFKFRS